MIENGLFHDGSVQEIFSLGVVVFLYSEQPEEGRRLDHWSGMR
jgi:hypothetical protein